MKRPSRFSRLAYKVIGEETIVLDTKLNRQVHQLDALGTFIWMLCDGEHSTEEIIKKVCDDFDVSSATATSDVNEFLKELAERSLIEEAQA